MTRDRSVFSPAVIFGAALGAAIFSLLVLGVFAVVAGQPFWMPLNVTTQIFFGPEVAQVRDFDVIHTVFGLLIHVASCIFWAVVAVLALKAVRTPGVAAMGTALLALIVDYGILPERLSPGWHLALPFPALIGGFVALGLGLWPSLPKVQETTPPRREPTTGPVIPQKTNDVSSGPELMRHPAPDVIDQRQQRIDPTNELTEDPNKRRDG